MNPLFRASQGQNQGTGGAAFLSGGSERESILSSCSLVAKFSNMWLEDWGPRFQRESALCSQGPSMRPLQRRHAESLSCLSLPDFSFCRISLPPARESSLLLRAPVIDGVHLDDPGSYPELSPQPQSHQLRLKVAACLPWPLTSLLRGQVKTKPVSGTGPLPSYVKASQTPPRLKAVEK